MSLFSSLSQGSLLSEENLMHAREGYRPTRVLPSTEMEFAHWTERMASQSSVVSARELAGLTEAKLAALAAEFVGAPRRKRVDRLRYSYPLAAALAVLGGLLYLAHLVLGDAPGGGAVLTLLQATSVGSVVSALLAAGVGGVASFMLVPIDVAYGRVGLYVGKLDERHPWLYRTFQVMKNSNAEAYRQRVLASRGPLRGVDYLMMREIAKAQEGLELTQTAHSVALVVQALPGSSVFAASQAVAQPEVPGE